MASRRRERGEGYIQKLPSGKLQAVLPLGFTTLPDGQRKRQRVSATFSTRREAQHWLREKALERDRGQGASNLLAGRVTVGEWLTQWSSHRQGTVAEKTWDHDDYRIRKYLVPRLGDFRLDRLTADDVRGLLAAMAVDGRSASERHKAGRVLRQALGQAVRDGTLARNVALAVPLPKVNRPEKQALTREQAQQITREASSHTRVGRLGALCILALDTGCRPGELFALHWPDVGWETRELFVHRSLQELRGKLKLKETKTVWSRRRILLAPSTLLALRAHRERMAEEGQELDQGLVFCDTEGGFLRQSNFQRRALNKWIKLAGVPKIRPYDLRHTSATLLLQAGVNVKVVSQRLGHEDIATTLRHYAHALPGMQEQAAEAVERLLGCAT